MRFLFAILLTVSFFPLMAQNANPNYDAELAANLGADDYGMKSYVFAMLKSGGNLSTEKAVRDSCFRGHLDNIGRLVKANKLILAGPFGGNEDDFRGLFILNVATVAEAEDLLSTDPAISADFLKAVLYPWYGSAALSEYLKASDKVWKVKP